MSAAPGGQQFIVRAPSGTARGMVTSITPASAGWGYSGLRIVALDPGQQLTIELPDDESVLIPLNGPVSVTTDAIQAHLMGRPDIWSGPTDFLYSPPATLAVNAHQDHGCRVAVATSRAKDGHEPRHVSASEVQIELRGGGQCSRQVNNYTIGTQVGTEHLLVCEVLTPGGNWSSYPPHKHDEHSGEERELEEIYYFEVADGPQGPGLAYHRVYGTPERPIDVCAEVATGDTVLVPHGYHGPSIAAPGYDLYYLNVMAGPATDRTWLSVDDPAHHWVRDTWAEQGIDPRLPFGGDASHLPSKDKEWT